jgi:hypothetical protein
MTLLRKAVPAVFAAALTLGAAPAVQAQVFTPTYMAPRLESSLGVYLADFGDLAVEGIWRGGFGGYNLGLRGGIADADDATGILLGGELRYPLSLQTAPLDLAFTSGIQGVLGDFEALGVQAGLSIGHTFVPDAGGLSITPYIHPRIGYVDPGETADGDLELMADLGFDLDFAPNLSLRFGAVFSDPGAEWGLGIAWR